MADTKHQPSVIRGLSGIHGPTGQKPENNHPVLVYFRLSPGLLKYYFGANNA